MIILPAIDILGGKCVRLTKGDYNTAIQVASDPIETALEFEKSGAEFIHMVDLDGARDGKRINGELFEAVAKKVHVPIEVGGGIRDMNSVEYYLSHGVQRAIIGSAALQNPDLVKQAVNAYGDRIAVGIDAMNGMVRTAGWLEESNIRFTELAKMMEKVGVSCIIFTDISKDGTLSGPNYEQLTELQKAVNCDIIASGGVRDASHICKLTSMNLYGAICGKSIYSGNLSLVEAIEIGKKST